MRTTICVSRRREGAFSAFVPRGGVFTAYARSFLLAAGLVGVGVGCSQAKSVEMPTHAQFSGGVFLSLKKSHVAGSRNPKGLLASQYRVFVNANETVTDIVFKEWPSRSGRRTPVGVFKTTCHNDGVVGKCPGFISLLEARPSAGPVFAGGDLTNEDEKRVTEEVGTSTERYAVGTGTVIVGAASMYNPYLNDETPHGAQTASGELYNPIAWTAAIQIDLRGEFSGVRYGRLYRPRYALVQAGGKQAIVKINDVGPLRPGRVIDLSAQSMQYFDPSLRRGVIDGVLVSPLAGDYWTPGPVGRTPAMSVADLIE